MYRALKRTTTVTCLDRTSTAKTELLFLVDSKAETQREEENERKDYIIFPNVKFPELREGCIFRSEISIKNRTERES